MLPKYKKYVYLEINEKSYIIIAKKEITSLKINN